MIPINVVELYEYADCRGYDVYWYTFDTNQVSSISLPLADGSCAIALDPGQFSSLADEKHKLAHELGHCETGSFYCRRTPFDERGRHERRAERWAIRKLLPFDDLNKAVVQGIREAWELAEYFELPEALILEAVEYYTGPCGFSFA